MTQKNVNQSEVRTKPSWLYVLLGIIIMMCLGTVYSWSVFRLHVEDLYNIGSTQSGLPYMVSLAIYAIFMILTGKFMDKYSPRLIILIGGLLIGLGWILSGFAQNVYVLTFTFGVITGAGVGIVYGAPLSVVAKWFPKQKGLMVGLVLIGFGLSPFVTAPMARNLVETYGILKAFQVLGVSFGVLIPLLSLPFQYPSEADRKIIGTTSSAVKKVKEIKTAAMVKSKSFKGFYLSFVIGTTIGLMLIGITSNIGTELINLSAKTVTSLFMPLFAVFNGIGRPIFGWLTDKLSQKKAMLISYSLILTAALLMLLTSEGSVVLYGIAFSLFWLNLGGWLAIAPTSTLALYGTKHYSQNYGVVFTAYGIGAIVGVLSSGLLRDLIQNYNSVFYLVIGLSILGIFLSQKMMKTD
jgi:MFS transporter, OFA family, oxalate/formate antiporter